ncbi:MAG: M48 family metalloprotease [Pseudomonadota bacterium]
MLGLTAPHGADAWTFAQEQLGRDAHAVVLTRHGGAYEDPALERYVRGVGLRLAAESRQPSAHWRFTILDNPALAAFPQPGGYIYVTRGLLAFAGSEAELAGVLAHQMALALEGDFGNPRDTQPVRGLAPGALLDGLIGGRDKYAVIPASFPRVSGARPVFSASQETAAVGEGLALLAAAGYPAAAMTSLANRLSEQETLAATMGGGARLMMFGATPEIRAQTLDALRLAAEAENTFALDNEDADYTTDYLNAIQGLVYGDSPAHGFVRGAAFVHPQLRFTFDLPAGFEVENTSAEVIARGANGALMVLDTTDDAGERLESYVRDTWAPSLTRQVQAGYLFDLVSTTVNGFPATMAFQPFSDDEGAKVAQLLVIRGQNRVYRFRSIARAEDFDTSLTMEAAMMSFREIPVTEAARYRPYWIQVHRIQPGENLNLLAASVPYRNNREAHFRVLNGYGGRSVPLVGDQVKLIME